MSQTLQTYVTECQRLLHDANANFYSVSELTDYINAARERTVRDTGCLRTIQRSATVASQEVYTYASLPSGSSTIDVLNLNIYWGNSRIPLRYLAWTNFNAQLRYWQNYTGTPVAFSIYGNGQIYLGPVPDQAYTMELDTVILPTALVNLTDVETQLVDPYTTPVAFYACYKAKFREQAYGESEIFNQQYMSQAKSVLATTFTRRIPNPYATPY